MLAGVAACLLASASLLGENGLPAYRRLDSQRTELALEVDRLRARESALRAGVDALRHDPEALERVARERYRMHKPGERIIEIVGDVASPPLLDLLAGARADSMPEPETATKPEEPFAPRGRAP